MKTVRTTITLSQDLHTQLRHQATKLKISLSELVSKRLNNQPLIKGELSLQERLQRDMKLMDTISRAGVSIDSVKTLREERDIS